MTQERIAAALERIAAALELANIARPWPYIPSSGATVSVFSCSTCRTYFPIGTVHYCGTAIR